MHRTIQQPRIGRILKRKINPIAMDDDLWTTSSLALTPRIIIIPIHRAMIGEIGQPPHQPLRHRHVFHDGILGQEMERIILPFAPHNVPMMDISSVQQIVVRIHTRQKFNQRRRCFKVSPLSHPHHLFKGMLGILNVLQQMTTIDEVKHPIRKRKRIRIYVQTEHLRSRVRPRRTPIYEMRRGGKGIGATADIQHRLSTMPREGRYHIRNPIPIHIPNTLTVLSPLHRL